MTNQIENVKFGGRPRFAKKKNQKNAFKFKFCWENLFLSVERLLFAHFWPHNSFICGSACNVWIEFNENKPNEYEPNEKDLNLPLRMGFVSII